MRRDEACVPQVYQQRHQIFDSSAQPEKLTESGEAGHGIVVLSKPSPVPSVVPVAKVQDPVVVSTRIESRALETTHLPERTHSEDPFLQSDDETMMREQAPLNLEQDTAASTLISTEQFTQMPILTRTPVMDTSSLLISNWFEQVCPAWSGFDSGTNLNRRLAIELWHDSQSVFSSLQSMSSAFLSTRLPHMRAPALRFMQIATVSIQAEVKAIKSRVHLDTMPTGLLFSLFCLGTTVCWIDANQLGLPFFREAKLLLNRLNRQFRSFYKKDLEILSYFNKSLTYCEMLLAVVSDEGESLSEESENPLAHRPRPSIERHGKPVDRSPHPWTGISTLTSHLFAQSIRVCRNFRRNLRKRRMGQADLQTALGEIQEAQRLEEQLLELEFPSVRQLNDTGDHRTPWLHLARVAEAYQLASLLQLYQTFPDLVSLRLPLSSGSLNGRDIPWEEWIIPLSLRLVKVLEHIPPHSGSRVIQPLLYISASTGLRYDMTTCPTSDISSYLDLGTIGLQTHLFSDEPNFTENADFLQGTNVSAQTTDSISPMSLDISNARHFIMGRLGMFENSLPPKPVIVARQLIRAIWDAYDSEVPGANAVHWVDVMEDNNLRSMFG
ncbi:hypothetical protein G7046_g457 [Stylonectria norvegica]|nr:hypothetical protein G7046_g457 [Stylonectria norvegica]